MIKSKCTGWRWVSQAIHLSGAIMVLHRQLTWSLTCANSRLDVSLVAMSHIDDVMSNM